MRTLVFALFAAAASMSLTGCFGSPDLMFANAVPGCKTSTALVDGQPVKTQFCIKAVMFKSSKYWVGVNDRVVFRGDDIERVAFTSQIAAGTVSGGCDEVIELQGGGGRNIPQRVLPPGLVAACHIDADAAGNSLAFIKDPTCDTAFYRTMAPLLGKVMPMEIARQCTVKLGTQTVFSERYDFR